MRTLLCFVATWTFATGLFCFCIVEQCKRKASQPPPRIVEPMPTTITSENGRIQVVAVKDTGTEAKEVVKLVLEMRLYAQDGTYKIANETEFLNARPRDERPDKEAPGDIIAGTWR